MSAKMSQARRAAFLRALETTGNITLSAERACVSRSWVLAQRKSDAAFEAACVAALAAAKARLGEAEAGKPPKGWGHLDGVELVVRGTGGSWGGRRVQIARARAGQWTARSEDRFLAVLKATCNAKAAYKAAGKSKGSAYTHRRRWPGFDRRWQAAEDVGYLTLEDALFERGENLFSSPRLPPDGPGPALPAMTIAEALQLLRLHQYQVREIGNPPGRWRRRRSLEEVQDSILRKLSAIARKHGLL